MTKRSRIKDLLNKASQSTYFIEPSASRPAGTLNRRDRRARRFHANKNPAVYVFRVCACKQSSDTRSSQ